jgi:hypothetical protein
MGGIYQALLRKIERDRFQMFRRRYRLSSAEKILVLSRTLLTNRLLGWSSSVRQPPDYGAAG